MLNSSMNNGFCAGGKNGLHPARPQTLFKSNVNQTGKHSVTAQCERVLISYRCAAVQSMQEVRAGIPPTVVNDP